MLHGDEEESLRWCARREKGRSGEPGKAEEGCCGSAVLKEESRFGGRRDGEKTGEPGMATEQDMYCCVDNTVIQLSK